jgi:hypothetical protein
MEVHQRLYELRVALDDTMDELLLRRDWITDVTRNHILGPMYQFSAYGVRWSLIFEARIACFWELAAMGPIRVVAHGLPLGDILSLFANPEISEELQKMLDTAE